MRRQSAMRQSATQLAIHRAAPRWCSVVTVCVLVAGCSKPSAPLPSETTQSRDSSRDALPALKKADPAPLPIRPAAGVANTLPERTTASEISAFSKAAADRGENAVAPPAVVELERHYLRPDVTVEMRTEIIREIARAETAQAIGVLTRIFQRERREELRLEIVSAIAAMENEQLAAAKLE